MDPARVVDVFPYMKNRLMPIDYLPIIAQNEPWTDTYFRPELTSILDPTIPKIARL